MLPRMSWIAATPRWRLGLARTLPLPALATGGQLLLSKGQAWRPSSEEPPIPGAVSSEKAVSGEPIQVPASFELFYKETKDQVLQFMLALTGKRPVAEDATQEAFVRAYAEWTRLEYHPDRRAWVFQVAMNAHRSWWRKRRREILSAETLDGAFHDIAHHWVDPDLMQALRALPAKQRAVVALRFLCNLTPREVAEVLGIAEGTVWAHQHKAMQRLRIALSSQSVVEEEP